MKHIPMFTGEPRELENKQMFNRNTFPVQIRQSPCGHAEVHDAQKLDACGEEACAQDSPNHLLCVLSVISLFNESVFILRTESQLYFQKVTF